MKTLAELAAEYYAEAQRLKSKISELEGKRHEYGGDASPAEEHILSVYNEMYFDCMSTYDKLKAYYDK